MALRFSARWHSPLTTRQSLKNGSIAGYVTILHWDNVGVIEIVHRRLTLKDAGEALTIQRAAFLAKAHLYDTTKIPPLLESLDDVRREIETRSLANRLVKAVGLQTVSWHRLYADIIQAVVATKR